MSANRLYLVCSHCRKLEDAFCLAQRDDAQAKYEDTNHKRFGDWLEKHSLCGNPDDLQLAFAKTQNWDVSPPAEATVAGAVRLGLVNGSDH